MRFELSKFVPISLTNTFSMHLLKSCKFNAPNKSPKDIVLRLNFLDDKDQNLLEKLQIFITDTNGLLHLVDDHVNNQCWDLKEYLDETTLEDFSLELVCADLYNFDCDQEQNELFCYIATCWLFYDDLFQPKRYMLAFFCVTKIFGFERRRCFGIFCRNQIYDEFLKNLLFQCSNLILILHLLVRV